MKYVDMDQNTLDWLNARKNFLGASDIPSVMQVSPWRTVFQLWEEKLGICSPDQADKAYIFNKGHRLEKVARHAYEMMIGYDIPSQVVQHSTIPWARSSLDCLNYNKGFVGEIKFMGVVDWTLLKEANVVPAKYYPQVQYQMFCTGLTENHFIGINERKEIAYTIVKADPVYIEKMIKWCSYFWMLKTECVAPKMTQQDYKYLSRKDAVAACSRIYEIDQDIDSLMKERRHLQAVALKQAKSTRMAFKDKLMVNISHFDTDDLGLVKELTEIDTTYIGRSIKDDLELIIIQNNNTHIKGASSERKKESKSKKTSSTKTRESSPKS